MCLQSVMLIWFLQCVRLDGSTTCVCTLGEQRCDKSLLRSFTYWKNAQDWPFSSTAHRPQRSLNRYINWFFSVETRWNCFLYEQIQLAQSAWEEWPALHEWRALWYPPAACDVSAEKHVSVSNAIPLELLLSVRMKAALLSQNWHSNISPDTVGLKPNTLTASTFLDIKHHQIHDVHLATSELAAVLRVCLNTSSTLSSSVTQLGLKEAHGRTLTFRFCQHNSINQQALLL